MSSAMSVHWSRLAAVVGQRYTLNMERGVTTSPSLRWMPKVGVGTPIGLMAMVPTAIWLR